MQLSTRSKNAYIHTLTNVLGIQIVRMVCKCHERICYDRDKKLKDGIRHIIIGNVAFENFTSLQRSETETRPDYRTEQSEEQQSF